MIGLRLPHVRSLCTWAGVLVMGSTLAFAQDRSLEYAVKATYVYKFAPFVHWPAQAFDSPTAPLTLCVLANESVAAVVDEAVKGKAADGRPFEVQHVTLPLRNVRCHILYVASSRAATIAQALDAVRGRPVLTVADEAPGGVDGLVINLATVDGRVRFEVDLRAAAANGLEVSSKLLALAIRVRSNP
jgi:hypothetical protein